jgi:hypothetical protein
MVPRAAGAGINFHPEESFAGLVDGETGRPYSLPKTPSASTP